GSGLAPVAAMTTGAGCPSDASSRVGMARPRKSPCPHGRRGTGPAKLRGPAGPASAASNPLTRRTGRTFKTAADDQAPGDTFRRGPHHGTPFFFHRPSVEADLSAFSPPRPDRGRERAGDSEGANPGACVPPALR